MGRWVLRRHELKRNYGDLLGGNIDLFCGRDDVTPGSAPGKEKRQIVGNDEENESGYVTRSIEDRFHPFLFRERQRKNAPKKSKHPLRGGNAFDLFIHRDSLGQRLRKGLEYRLYLVMVILTIFEIDVQGDSTVIGEGLEEFQKRKGYGNL